MALIAVFIIMVCPKVLFYEVEQNGIGVTGFATLDVKKDIRHLLKDRGVVSLKYHPCRVGRKAIVHC